jgi:DNA-binding beta-propeller fold protein YncE
MRGWGLGAVMLLTILVIGCGGNSTVVGITISGPGLSPLTIIVNHPAQFAANVTGASTTTVFWQICEPPATPSTTIPPTECTAGQGPTGCTIRSVTTPITGFGTITLNGLYTAPPTVPQPATFLIVATSCINATAFTTFTVTIDSGIRVQLSPLTASIGPGENFQFTASVTGTSNTAIVWLVNTIPGGNATVGIICPNMNSPVCCPNSGTPVCIGTPPGSPGEYFAPTTSPGSVSVTAQSGADSTQEESATVTIGSGGPPTFSATGPLEPTVAAEGSVQQDVYVSGTNLLSTTQVVVSGVPIPAANVTLLSTGTLLRATIPAAQLAQAGSIGISLVSQSGALSSGTLTLQVDPVRPALIASTPDSVQQDNGGASLTVNLTGGYFVPSKTTATFDGIGCGGGAQVCTTFVDSRHLTVSIQDASLGTPGLYPLIIQNSDAATAGVPSISGVNLGVTPDPASISGSPTPTIGVGLSPSAVAIDEADGIAVVANTGSNSVSLVNLLTNAVIGGAITVGTAPTGVAVDDLLPDHLAYVVNSGSNSISVIDLSLATPAVTQTLSLGSYAPGLIPIGTVPFSIGANPLTHRAFVANQSTNVGTILDLANANTSLTPPCATPPCPVSTITSGVTSYGTGPSPNVSVDPRLNWAMVTPGGAGTTALVDLGRAASAGDVGRMPELIGSLGISSTIQGVGINTETHQALLTDPSASTLTLFSLLNDAVAPVHFTVNGVALDTLNYSASAVNPLEDVGVAIQGSVTGATAVVTDLENGVVLKQVSGLGGMPEAVAVDPVSNEAVIVNGGSGSVSILSLGPALTSPQILEASPASTLTSALPLQLMITGGNFTPGSVVRLDQVPLATPVASSCAATCRQLTATVPASMLGAARRYLVDVLNADGSVSNVTDLNVIQAVSVGSSPVAVAVDTDRDMAIVTNSLDDTASVVSLTPVSPTFSPESLGPVGVIGAPISVGTAPEGVAIIPRLGIAVVANNGSNDITAIDVTTTPSALPIPAIPLCGESCSNPTGVAFNQDTATAAVTSTNSGNLFSTGSVSFVSVSRTITATSNTITAALGGSPSVDQNPIAVAVDPTLDFAAVATASSTSSLDIIDIAGEQIVGRVNNLENPSGVVFDPVNQVFLTVNSLLNNIDITNPATLTTTTVSVGIAPTSVDYNFQTSSLVTLNSGSHTMSVLDYTCPPSIAAPACTNPQVRAVLGLGGAQTSTFVLGPNAVAIDPKLNLAVLVDPDNNRVLLVPMPH